MRSRCETLALSPVSVLEAEAWLKARYPDKSLSVLCNTARQCEGLLGRAVGALEDGENSDSQVRDMALALTNCFSSGDELALAEYCISLEKWDRDKLSTLMEETILLLRDALLQHSGTGQEHDPQRRESAARLAAALTPRAMLDSISTLEQLRTACGFHVGAGHLSGWLCARLASIKN